jgi:penicillin-binding protein 1A
MNQKLGIITVLTLFIIVIFSFTGLRKEYENYIPFDKAVHSLADVKTISLEQNSRLLDSNGHVIYEFKGNQSRIPLSYKQIPLFIRQAFIATEDQNFLQHHGIDGKAIARAFIENSSEGTIAQGGSTITQQLARNLFLTQTRSYDRKLKELLISYRIEQQLKKEQILELYINAIYFQNGIYGIEQASQFYFNKPASQLTLGESALLAAIPNNPQFYDPLTHLANTKKRQEWILVKMKEQGFINDQQFNSAIKQPIKLDTAKTPVPFPEVIGFIKNELTELVASAPQNKGLSSDQVILKTNALLTSGAVIETSLNPELQKVATAAVQERLPFSNIEGAAVIIDHTANQIAAITGGKQSGLEQFNRAYQSRLQPGSAIKPLLVYAPYIDVFGANANSIISAAKVCVRSYCPENYGGTSYGSMPIKKAMARSVNTAAVRLLNKTGVERAFSYLEPFHFSAITIQDHQLASALGGFSRGFSPLELTSAYTTFSNNGTFVHPRIITAIKDKKGTVLYEWKEPPVPVWKKETNDQMRVMLEEVTRSGTATDARFPGSKYIGGKTGTTNDAKDLWFIGITDRYTGGVWVGRDKPGSLGSVEKSSPEVMIWRDIMMKAYQK